MIVFCQSDLTLRARYLNRYRRKAARELLDDKLLSTDTGGRHLNDDVTGTPALTEIRKEKQQFLKEKRQRDKEWECYITDTRPVIMANYSTFE